MIARREDSRHNPEATHAWTGENHTFVKYVQAKERAARRICERLSTERVAAYNPSSDDLRHIQFQRALAKDLLSMSALLRVVFRKLLEIETLSESTNPTELREWLSHITEDRDLKGEMKTLIEDAARYSNT